MKIENALNKFQKLGFKVNQSQNDPRDYWIEGKKDILSFWTDDKGEIRGGIKVRDKNDHDDAMTDYSAGVWCKNLSQALRLFDK